MSPDWTTRKIRDIATRVRDINVAGADLPPLSVTKDRGVMLQSDKFSKRIATDVRKYLVAKKEQFVFDPMSLYYGAIGRIAAPDIGLVSPDYVVFETDESVVDARFLEYLLRSEPLLGRYATLAEGGSQLGKRRRVYWSVFQEICLALPALSEQKRIVAVLSSIDDVLQHTQAVLEQLERTMRAVTTSLLTYGLPGRHHAFCWTELGTLPADWRVERLEQVVAPGTVVTYGIVQAGPHVEDGVPYIRTGDVKPGGIDVTKLLRTSRDIAAKYKRSEVSNGDLVFCIRATVGAVEQVPPELHGANLTQGTARLSPGPRINARYLLWALRSTAVQEWIGLQCKGSTFREITLASLRATPIPVPTLGEQASIASVLDNIDDRLREEGAVLRSLQELKNRLLSALLTGEIRVPLTAESP